jgi:hypothetical protein
MRRVIAHAWIAAAVVMSVLVWPSAASAQDDDAFRRGLDARDDKDWKVMAAQMRAAIERDPKESTRKAGGGFLGRGNKEYIPYFFLGEALFNLQDCVGAATAWGVSEQQGVVPSLKEYATLVGNGYQACAARGVLPPSQYNPLLASTTQTVRETTAYAERLSKRGSENIDAWRPDIAEQYTRASAEITAANVRLMAGTRARSAVDFAEARAAANRANAVLRTLETALNANIDNLGVVRRQVRELNDLIASVENTDRAIEATKVPLSAELATARGNGRDLLARARDRARAGES